MAASHVDARQSTFNQVGGDQTTIIHNHLTIILPPGLSRRRSCLAIDIADTLSLPIRGTETSSHEILGRYSSSSTIALIGTAVDLVEQIAELLMDCTQTPDGLWDLALELESLQRTLTLIRLAIQMYDNQPLGYSLTNTITPEVLRCFFILRELFDSVDGAWLDVTITSIFGFWRRIRWAMLGEDNFALLKKLSASRQSLQALLVALYSYVSFILHPRLKAYFFHQSIMECCMDGTWKRITGRLCFS
jgi:hypothetical protein